MRWNIVTTASAVRISFTAKLMLAVIRFMSVARLYGVIMVLVDSFKSSGGDQIGNGRFAKARTSKWYRGFESLPHRCIQTHFTPLLQRLIRGWLTFSKAKLEEF
jgi:hypothetical protein